MQNRACTCDGHGNARSCDDDDLILRRPFHLQNAMKRQRNVRALISVLTPSATAARTLYRMQISQIW